MPKRTLEKPIHVAAYYNSIDELKVMLDRGVNPNIKAKNGMNALHFALAHGNMASAELLMKYGARLLPGRLGAYEALRIAVAHGYVKIVRFLLFRGVKPNHRSTTGTRSPLHLAAMEQEPSHVSITKMLLSAGASPRSKDGKGNTPIQLLKEYMDGPLGHRDFVDDYEKKIKLLEAAVARKRRFKK